MNEEYSKLRSSKEFKEWRGKHKDSFLCSYIFIDNSQFDFYNKDDTLTSFSIKDKIEVTENQKFLKSSNKLKELSLDEIKLSQDEALELIEEKKDYHKKIIILQKTKKPFWNITLISPTGLINMKIDAVTKQIL